MNINNNLLLLLVLLLFASPHCMSQGWLEKIVEKKAQKKG